VDSVISRVLNLQELNPSINHDTFCNALVEEFVSKWGKDKQVNQKTLSIAELEQIPKLMEIYKKAEDWNWRFGSTPDFTNSIEHKFSWALVDF